MAEPPTSAEAAPPTPLKAPTISGIWIILTTRAKYRPRKVPMATQTRMMARAVDWLKTSK